MTSFVVRDASLSISPECGQGEPVDAYSVDSPKLGRPCSNVVKPLPRMQGLKYRDQFPGTRQINPCLKAVHVLRFIANNARRLTTE